MYVLRFSRADQKYVEVCIDDFSLACSFYNSVCLDFGFVRSGLYFYDNIRHDLILVDESERV